MSVVDVLLERETANDEAAVIVNVLVASGAPVEEDQLLFEIENSKAVQELRASKGGVLAHDLDVGTTVGFGVPIARIYSPEAWNGRDLTADAAPAPASAQPAPTSEPIRPDPSPLEDARPAGPPQFSRAAAELMAKLDISRSVFNSGLITSADVLLKAGRAAPQKAVSKEAKAKPAPVNGGSATGEGKAVDHRKRVEIETLTSGAGNSMLSVLGVDLGRVAIKRPAGSLLNGSITDLVIFEASRLMRKFPKLNSYFQDGRIIEHEPVHAGLAIDSGGRLVVYGIENADAVGLFELDELIADAVGRYMDNALTAAEMSRATFTITDLSATELDFVLPLLPKGQSCIIGVTKAGKANFRLFAGFDHRVTEGGEVARFLGELKARITSFVSEQGADADEASCDYCGRTVGEVVVTNKDKGLLAIRNQQGDLTHCCASCWNGW